MFPAALLVRDSRAPEGVGSNWGEPDCAGPETGGQTTPDAGAWVVDIRNLSDPVTRGFIPSSQDSRPGEGMQVVNISTESFNGQMLVMNNEHYGKERQGRRLALRREQPAEARQALRALGRP